MNADQEGVHGQGWRAIPAGARRSLYHHQDKIVDGLSPILMVASVFEKSPVVTISSGLSLRMIGGIALVWLTCGPAFARQDSEPESSEISEPVTKILERPLFEPDRRHKEIVHQKNGEFHLVGIFGHAGMWKAIFKPDRGGGKSLVLSGDGRVNDWTIASVDPAGVNLTQGEKTKRIFMMFSKSGNPASPEKIRR